MKKNQNQKQKTMNCKNKKMSNNSLIQELQKEIIECQNKFAEI